MTITIDIDNPRDRERMRELLRLAEAEDRPGRTRARRGPVPIRPPEAPVSDVARARARELLRREGFDVKEPA